VFVAGFIGSPAMNLFEGRISDDGSQFTISDDGPILPLGLPPKLPSKLSPHSAISASTAEGEARPSGSTSLPRDVIVGIRPEHFVIDGRSAGPDGVTGSPQTVASNVTLVVDSCEMLGADNIAHGRWGRHDVACRLPYSYRPALGERLALGWAPEHVHLFDATSGLRLN